MLNQDPPRPGEPASLRSLATTKTGVAHTRNNGLPSELQNSFHLSTVHPPRLPGEIRRGQEEEGGTFCLAGDLRGGAAGKGDGPLPGARPTRSCKEPRPWVAGDQLPFSKAPSPCRAHSALTCAGSSPPSLPPQTHPFVQPPHPKQACPSRADQGCRARGRSSEAAQTPQPRDFSARRLSQVFPFTSPCLPSRGTPPPTHSHPPGNPTPVSCTDVLASSSEKRRAKSLAGNDQ